MYKNLKSDSATMYLIIGANALADFLCGILLPPPVGFYALVCVSVIFGTSIYFLTYKIYASTILWRELRLFIVALVGNSLGAGLLWIYCKLGIIAEVCMPHKLEGQLIATYAFPAIFLLFAWLFGSLPNIISKRVK